MTVIFHHIPKTAGRTLEAILERHYSKDEIFDIDRSRGVREASFAELPLGDRSRIRLIKGHMDFGIHEHVPGSFTYVTMLRHPTNRVISHYHYVKRSPRHRLYARVRDMSLEEYVSGGIALELNNGQVRGLVGPAHLDTAFGECSREMLDTARRNLKAHFSVVGFTEQFDESLLLLARRLGWRTWPFYRRRNVSKANPGTSVVPQPVVRLIERFNPLDLELYEEQRTAFMRTVTDLGLEKDLLRFRALNRFLGPCTAIPRAPRLVFRQVTANRSRAN